MSTGAPAVRSSHCVPARAALLFSMMLVAWLGPLDAFAAEVIHSFESDVQVAKDGELTVSETIRVRAEGRAIRRGI